MKVAKMELSCLGTDNHSRYLLTGCEGDRFIDDRTPTWAPIAELGNLMGNANRKDTKPM